MALKSSTIGSEADSDMPSLICPGDVKRLAKDRESLVGEWVRQENAEPPFQDNHMGRAQISIVSPRKAPPGAYPAVGHPYHNPRVYNPLRQNLHRYRTGGESKEQNSTHCQAGDSADASSQKTTDIGMAAPASPGTRADRDRSKVVEMSPRSPSLTIEVISDYSKAGSSALVDPEAQEIA